MAKTLTALLLIDVQRGFQRPSWGPRSNPGAEAAAGRALAAARAARLPVIHIRHDSRSPDSPLRPGQPGNDFAAEAQPLPGEVVIGKAVNSAFIGTDLEARLKALGVTHLVTAGIATDHCVSTTVRMAANLGYHVTVLTDAATAFDRLDHTGETVPAEVVHRAALASLRGEFAELTTVGVFVAGLGGAG